MKRFTNTREQREGRRKGMKRPPIISHYFSFQSLVVALLFFGEFSTVISWTETIPPFFNPILSKKLQLMNNSNQFFPLHTQISDNINTGNTQDDVNNPTAATPISEMKIREIQTELKERGVSFSDCFDRDSLTKRLIEVRSSSTTSNTADSDDKTANISTTDDVVGMDDKETTSTVSTIEVNDEVEEKEDSSPSTTNTDTTTTTDTTTSESEFNRDKVLEKNRSLRVAELRTQLASRNIRWGNMIEKEELVIALTNSMEESFNFSPSGRLSPGSVSELTDEDLSLELSPSSSSSSSKVLPPLLVDFYATWCGPCQMMAPELEKVAAELNAKVRIGKLDTDKHTRWPGQLGVKGLPTLVLFDGSTGKEIDRVEGALAKDGLMMFAQKGLI